MTGHRIEVFAPDGIGEITPDTNLAQVVAQHLDLVDGDIVAITSKVVSKAEGQIRSGDRGDALQRESRRVVARRLTSTHHWVTIVRNRLGLTMAAAGIDASNVESGKFLLLPVDPDATARRLRRELVELAHANVGVVITDTSGRAWREGQTDLAIGAAGVIPAESFAGRFDGYGNALAVTMPAVVDEIAGAAELAQSKLGGRPVALVRGRADLVLPVGQDGPGAATLIRPEGSDLFGYGAREAVLRALIGDPQSRAPFGAPVLADELAEALHEVGAQILSHHSDRLTVSFDGELTVLRTLGFAFGWRVATLDGPRAGHAELTPLPAPPLDLLD